MNKYQEKKAKKVIKALVKKDRPIWVIRSLQDLEKYSSKQKFLNSATVSPTYSRGWLVNNHIIIWAVNLNQRKRNETNKRLSFARQI